MQKKSGTTKIKKLEMADLRHLQICSCQTILNQRKNIR